MDGSACPKLASHVRLGRDRVSGGSVLLAPETVLALNPTAVAVLELCNGERTLDEIVEQLASRFDAPADQLRGDVDALLQRLVDRGYVAFCFPSR